MTTRKALNERPYAGNPHVRLVEGDVAPAAQQKRGPLLGRTFVAAALATCVFATIAADKAMVSSPDGAITFAVYADGRLGYEVVHRGATLVERSAMGFAFAGEKPMGEGMELVGDPQVETGLVEEWTPVVKNKHAHVKMGYNRMTVRLREKSGDRRRMDVTVKVFDDGAAFRYTLYGSSRLGERRIVEEETEFRAPAGSHAWTAGVHGKDGYNDDQEAVFTKTPVAAMPEGRNFLVPFLVEVNPSNYFALASAALDDYPGFLVDRKGVALRTRLVPHPDDGAKGVKARFAGRRDTPWRVIFIGDSPGRFIESELVRALNPPCAIEDPSWIKPGMSAWDHWWTGDVKMTMPAIKEYIDFAAREGWPYMLVDWQWYGKFNNPNADITKPAPQLDMPALIAYAKARGVRLWLWLYSSDAERNDAYVEAFATYERWGIAGVKIDFMNRYDREIVNWYRKIAKAAAAHRLMVDFHGAFAPDGIDRTYPNQITREGVMGEEYLKFSNKHTPTFNVTVPFTRMLAGAMDYTPGGFLNVERKDFRQQSPTLVMNTRCAELAKFVIYESPYMCYADHPKHVIGQAGEEFVANVPTHWDDIRFLGGYPGEWVAIAKRSGTAWYVGVMCGDAAKDVEIDLATIGPLAGKTFETWADGPAGPRDVQKDVRPVKDGRLKLSLAAGGGFAGILR